MKLLLLLVALAIAAAQAPLAVRAPVPTDGRVLALRSATGAVPSSQQMQFNHSLNQLLPNALNTYTFDQISNAAQAAATLGLVVVPPGGQLPAAKMRPKVHVTLSISCCPLSATLTATI